MKKLPLLAVLAATATLHAADAPSATAAKPMRTQQQLAADKRALAVKLVSTLKIAEQLKAEIGGIHAALDNNFARMLEGPAAKHRELVEKHRAAMHTLIDESFEIESLKNEVVKTCAEAFSERELRDVVAFYESASGKSFAAKSPEMFRAAGVSLQSRKGALDPKIAAQIQRMNLDMQTADNATGGAAPASPAAK